MKRSSLKFDSMPAPANARALLTLSRRPRPDAQVPELAGEVRKFTPNPRHLARYRQLCGYAEGEMLPLPYPQVVAAGLQMRLLLQQEFPLPLLGLVHLQNVIEQEEPLAAEASYVVRVGLGNGRRTDRGLEFDITTEFSRTRGGVLWRSVATALSRVAGPPRPRRGEPQPAPARLRDYVLVDAPADIGRRYAPVAGDRNPIHLYALTARAFGFRRPIAHGMWSLARCDALLQAQLPRPASRLEARFRQPLLLPGRAALRFAAGERGIEFTLLARSDGRPHLTGVLE